ncbi:phage tail assembly chaperone G [Clostridium sp.]|uniref:phage tail assembly chaperone G n=1 Tax=Clostridium sp. TaxID=1506 RepID=UPI00399384A0
MNIRIIQEGKTNTYKLGEVKGSAFRKFLVARDVLIEAEKTGDFTVEMFDKLIDFIVSAFNNQFTADELLDSMDIVDINLLVLEIQKEVDKKTESKMKKLASTL